MGRRIHEDCRRRPMWRIRRHQVHRRAGRFRSVPSGKGRPSNAPSVLFSLVLFSPPLFAYFATIRVSHHSEKALCHHGPVIVRTLRCLDSQSRKGEGTLRRGTEVKGLVKMRLICHRDVVQYTPKHSTFAVRPGLSGTSRAMARGFCLLWTRPERHIVNGAIRWSLSSEVSP